MREPAFQKRNKEKWLQYKKDLNELDEVTPDEQADMFIELTDDLAYSRTFYPESNTTKFLNNLAVKLHQAIYKNRKERGNRILDFWRVELPTLFYHSHRQLLLSFIIFSIAIGVGVLSSANDGTFVRLILGDAYVNMTLDNIAKGDPMGVYGDSPADAMFLMITINNIRVSFMAFVMGALFSFGTGLVLFYNGVMLGAFQYFFYEKGLFITSFLAIWIHGTLEISAIVIAGCAGFVMGNSILFPGTYSRLESFKKGAKQGLKIIIGLVPVFIAAGFLESFMTRHYQNSWVVNLSIILLSLGFIIAYFIIYPIYLNNQLPYEHHTNSQIKRE